MQNRYAWALLPVLGWVLGACSSNQTEEKEDMPTAAVSPTVPAADSAGRVAADTTAVPRPNAEVKPAAKPRVAAMPYRAPARKTWRQGPAQVDAVSVLGLGDGQASADMAASAEALRNFLASGLAAAQEFVLKPTRDTLLQGVQGTQILVPANAWNVPANAGPIQLKMREFYQMDNILLAGLGTTAQGRLLETGGMLHLEATAGGQPVTLRPDAALQLRFPAAKLQADMQLFRGVPQAKGVDWELDTTTITRRFSFNPMSFDTTLAQSQGAYWPQYQAGRASQRAELRQISYPADDVFQLLAERPSAQELATLAAYNSFSSGTTRKVQRMSEVEFTVDTAGTTTRALVRPGFASVLSAPVVEVVKRWRGWKPAVRTGQYGAETVACVGVVRVLVLQTGQVVISPVAWDYDATDSPLLVQEAARQKAGLPSSADFFQELMTRNLGWINCDRILNPSQPLFAFEVDAPSIDTQASLVMQGSRTVISGQTDADDRKIRFRAPTDTWATIVAMRWKQGQAYLAVQPISLFSYARHKPLDFRPVTMQQMRKALQKL